MATSAVLFEQWLNVFDEIRRAAGRYERQRGNKTDSSHKNFVTPGFGKGEGVKLPCQSMTSGPRRSCEFIA